MYAWHEAGDGVRVAMNHGGNALVLSAAAGGESLLVDCKDPGFGASVRRAIRAVGVDLTHVVNTHHHADHTGGNSAFTGDLPVFAHARCATRCGEQMERYLRGAKDAMVGLSEEDPLYADLVALVGPAAAPKASDFQATRPIEGDARELRVGGSPVILRHVGSGHTDNDLLVWCPDQNVLHTGDLVFNGLNPYIDVTAGATTRGWDRSLRAMLALCNDDTVVVPGHGPVGDPGVLHAQLAYFGALRETVAEAIGKGLNREAVTGLQPAIFTELGFKQLGTRNLGVVFDELTDEG
jgi:glyoxylase-like metal-dependent hydrolase (beta-lactamase superfamily II)